MNYTELHAAMKRLDYNSLYELVQEGTKELETRQKEVQKEEWAVLVNQLTSYITKWGEIEIQIGNGEMFYLNDTLTDTGVGFLDVD